MQTTQITTHEIACNFLERSTAMPDVSMLPKHQQQRVIADIMKDNIAEAINKADNFIPDLADYNQEKWFLFFNHRGFAFSHSNFVLWNSCTGVGSRHCFRDRKTADFFGTQFNDLHLQTITLMP